MQWYTKPEPEQVIGWTIVYVILIYCILWFCTEVIPDIDIQSETYRSLFSRGNTHNTTWLPLGNYIFYVLMNITGFIYINVSNLNFGRKSVFYSRTHSYTHFYMNIWISAVTFFLCHNVCLQSVHGLTNTHDGQLLSKSSTFEYNLDYWVPGFIIGLQYTHLDVNALRKFSLSPEFIAKWGFSEWTFLSFTIIGLGLLLYQCMQYWITIDLLFDVSIVFLSQLVLLALVTFITSRYGYIFHLHHYLVAMVLQSVLGVQVPFMTFVCGLMNGTMVEGGARWGYDPIWEIPKP